MMGKYEAEPDGWNGYKGNERDTVMHEPRHSTDCDPGAPLPPWVDAAAAEAWWELRQ